MSFPVRPPVRFACFCLSVGWLVLGAAGLGAARSGRETGAAFLAGYRAFQNEDWEAAAAGLGKVSNDRPLLADYGLYFLGRVHLRTGRDDRAQAVLERLLREYPDSVWQADAALELAALAFGQGQYAPALKLARRARKASFADDTARHRSALLIAQAHERRGEFRRACRGYQDLRAAAPGTSAGRTAKAHSQRLRTEQPDAFGITTAQHVLDEARLLQKEGDLAAATELAARFRTGFRASPLRPDGLLLLADVSARAGRFEDAVEEWRRIVAQYADTPQAVDALYRWARALWNRDEDVHALSVFVRLTAEYPRKTRAADARYAIGRIAEAAGRDAEATTAYRTVARDFPNTSQAREARWRLGWLAYLRGDDEAARRAFRDLGRDRRASAMETARAWYWHARAGERAGKADAAAERYARLLHRYPHGYYALWAERRLNRVPTALSFRPLPDSAPPSSNAAQARRYRRGLALDALGLRAFARRELDLLRRGAPETRGWTRFLLAAQHRLGDHTAAFRLASRANLDRAVQRGYVYPRAYWDVVSAEAERQGVDAYLMLSLIRQESLFDPRAVSRANAVGLMQLLPRTAARLTDAPLDGGRALFDPGLNVRLGTTYLRALLDRYRGSIVLALAAYNAGETAADKWLAQFGHLEADAFIENISFRETRGYVKLVLRNYRTYRRLYAPRQARLDPRLP